MMHYRSTVTILCLNVLATGKIRPRGKLHLLWSTCCSSEKKMQNFCTFSRLYLYFYTYSRSEKLVYKFQDIFKNSLNETSYKIIYYRLKRKENHVWISDEKLLVFELTMHYAPLQVFFNWRKYLDTCGEVLVHVDKFVQGRQAMI